MMQLPLALASISNHTFCTDPTMLMSLAIAWIPVMHAWYVAPQYQWAI